MKRLVPGLAVLLLLADAPLFAAQKSLVDDVIRMSKAGVSDEAILAFVRGTHDRAAVSADDVIAMSEAGVSKAVIEAMITEVPAPDAQAASSAPADTPSGDQAAPPDTAPPAI